MLLPIDQDLLCDPDKEGNSNGLISSRWIVVVLSLRQLFLIVSHFRGRLSVLCLLLFGSVEVSL